MFQDEEILEDPACNPNNPQKITFQDITSAAFKIKSGIELTPCIVKLYSDSLIFLINLITFCRDLTYQI